MLKQLLNFRYFSKENNANQHGVLQVSLKVSGTANSTWNNVLQKCLLKCLVRRKYLHNKMPLLTAQWASLSWFEKKLRGLNTIFVLFSRQFQNIMKILSPSQMLIHICPDLGSYLSPLKFSSFQDTNINPYSLFSYAERFLSLPTS